MVDAITIQANGHLLPPKPADGVLPPAIGEHRFIYDGRSTALVRPDAEIDWWCAPELDDPPLLWSLLDAGGAAARWTGARMVRRSGEPAGPCALTTISIAGRAVECRDGLLGTEAGGPALVRLARSVDGSAMVISHELSVGGFDQPFGEWSDRVHTVLATTPIRVSASPPTTHSEVEGRWLRTTVELPAHGEWVGIVVTCGPPLDLPVEWLVALLDERERALQAELDRAHRPRHHPERAEDALRVLEACTYAPTGAVIAAPTTSLPEAPGGDRQFDYRYSWLRDASLAVSVAALLGERDVARRYLGFVGRVTASAYVPSGPMTDVRGGEVPSEREVAGVSGWAGSLPVRVGNGAAHQVQLDGVGLLLEAVSVYLQTGGSLDSDTWRMVRELADEVAGDRTQISSGIWELRTPRNLVSADIGRWMALDRAIWISRGWHPLARRSRWKRGRAAARDRVLAAIEGDGLIPQSYDTPGVADASALMVVVFGLLDRRDPRAERLVDAVLTRLDAWPFLYRYEPAGDDGFRGQEGAFLPVSWWAVDALAAVGRLDEAVERADAMCARLPRLLAEEIDPERGICLGNAPLLWSHMEAARTMYLLDAAARRRTWGTGGLWAWRLGRYARLRYAARTSGSSRAERSAAMPPHCNGSGERRSTDNSTPAPTPRPGVLQGVPR